MVGRYNEPHIQLTVDRAIDLIMHDPEQQGYELIVPRAIKKNEIHKIKELSQVLGWRYYPKAHSSQPNCACSMCLPKGSIKSKKLRERLAIAEKRQNYAELIAQLKATQDSQIIIQTLYNIYSTVRGGNRKKADDLEFLTNHPSEEVIEALAYTLGAYSGNNVINILLKLCTHENDDCRAASARSLLEILQQDALVYLNSFKGDEVIIEVLKDYINSNASKIEIK